MNRSSPETTMPVNAEPTTKEIPYDYVATFKLSGKMPGNRVQDVINISVEGAFVAVAIGYSFIPKLQPPPPLPDILVSTQTPPTTTTLFRIIGENIGRAVTPPSGVNAQDVIAQLAAVAQPIVDTRLLLHCLTLRLCGIDFKYSIVDSGSGRELQNQPIHNIAGLGESNGDRPFRPLAKPALFMPRSTIRIEIEEISVGPIYEDAQLFIVLHGYKMLGYGTALP
jgi:hypothetical protein